MIAIQNILVSNEILKRKFICDLSKCKGACCTKGDFGAPLEDEEINILIDIYSKIKPYLTLEGIEAIEKNGVYMKYGKEKFAGTTLIDGKACAFISFKEDGTATCGIEKAHEEGVINFKKPVSCHLYPIRHSKDEALDFKALNYDEWDICSAACSLGAKKNVPVYQFVKEGIIRKFGADFYEELDAAYTAFSHDI